jgi:D-arabinitol 4-dehydrogenase
MSIMLHIGLGSFHRAHQAVYLHRLRETGDRTWAIVGGNSRPDMPESIAALMAQDGRPTVCGLTRPSHPSSV